MKNTSKQSSKDRYTQLSQLGSKLNLTFSSQMSIAGKTIALDGLKRKLLVLDDGSRHYVIHLDDVKNISVKKTYTSIKPGELDKKRFDEFLQAILLYFEYRDGGRPVTLPFYERGNNSLHDLPMLERNARNWQMILSKMISTATELSKEKTKALSVA